MRPEEVAAVGDLAADAVGGVAARVQDVHAGIARRVFWTLGAGATPVRLIHDGIAGISYRAVRGISAAVLRSGAVAAGAVLPHDAESIDSGRLGRRAVGALNGAFGDALERRQSPLAVQLTLRRAGRSVTPVADSLAHAYPDATPRLAVFLHGLGSSEDAWNRAADRVPTYGARLRLELDYTPIYVRYNSGRHISENGRELGRLLEQVQREWPTELTEIALIGHAMGGLLARSACHYGAGSRWVGHVRHVVALGSPHHGAPFEHVARATSAAFSRLPETRAVTKALSVRSAGVRDLGGGYLVDEDWSGADRDAHHPDPGREIPFLRTANHYFVSASLTRSAEAPLGRLLGDLLVLRSSAWAHGRQGERLRFPVDNYRHIGAANHFDLLNHPAVGDQLVRWLRGRPELPAPVPGCGRGRPRVLAARLESDLEWTPWPRAVSAQAQAWQRV